MIQTYIYVKDILKESKLGTMDSVTFCIAPSKSDIEILSTKLALDSDMIHDALDKYETPRIEQDEGVTYFYVRYCNPSNNELATEPITIVATKKQLVVILRKDSDFVGIAKKALMSPFAQRTRLVLSLLSEINKTYRTYLLKVSREVLGVRSKLNKHDIDNKDFINFIDIEEDLNEITGALQSYDQVMTTLLRGKTLKLYEQDVDLAEDVELSIKELLVVAETRKLTIASTREAYSTIMANNLNKTFKKLTSISIFMTIPTITSGLYGMNLTLPLSHNRLAFWYILGIVMAITGTVVWLFKKFKWL
jgi:magnesium transporter